MTIHITPLPDEAQTLIHAHLDVHESQSVFRILIDTMSRPGIVASLPSAISFRIEPTIIPLLALLGHATPFSVVGPGSDFLSHIIARTTGANAVEIGNASFIACLESPGNAFFDQIKMGTADRPDTASQIVLSCPSFSNQRTDAFSYELVLSGPGVDGEISVFFQTDQDCVFSYITNRPQQFPLGCDIWFVSDEGLITAIARTTVVTLVKEEK